METLAVFVVILVIVVALAAKLKPTIGAEDFPYQQKPQLFTAAERSFLGVLDQAVGDSYRIMGQVRVADVVEVKRLADRSRRQKAQNKIQSKHFDFVLCKPNDLAVVAVIELDDRSHQRADRRKRDRFLERLCETVCLPLIRVPAKRAYSIPEVRELVIGTITPDALSESPGQFEEPSFADSEPPETSSSLTPTPAQQDDEKPKPPLCTRCWSPTVRRQFKSGPKQGQHFWGCSRFPKCRAVAPVETESQKDTREPGIAPPSK